MAITGPSGMDVSAKRVNGNGDTQEFEGTTNLNGKSDSITGHGPEGTNSML